MNSLILQMILLHKFYYKLLAREVSHRGQTYVYVLLSLKSKICPYCLRNVYKRREENNNVLNS